MGWTRSAGSSGIGRFGQILAARLNAERLATDGVVAFSAIRTHAGCVVVGWKPTEGCFLCPCQGSVFDPAAGGHVVSGPAPRPLPALPLRLNDGVLTVAGDFTGRVGGSTGRMD